MSFDTKTGEIVCLLKTDEEDELHGFLRRAQIRFSNYLTQGRTTTVVIN